MMFHPAKVIRNSMPRSEGNGQTLIVYPTRGHRIPARQAASSRISLQRRNSQPPAPAPRPFPIRVARSPGYSWDTYRSARPDRMSLLDRLFESQERLAAVCSEQIGILDGVRELSISTVIHAVKYNERMARLRPSQSQ